MIKKQIQRFKFGLVNFYMPSIWSKFGLVRKETPANALCNSRLMSEFYESLETI